MGVEGGGGEDPSGIKILKFLQKIPFISAEFCLGFAVDPSGIKDFRVSLVDICSHTVEKKYFSMRPFFHQYKKSTFRCGIYKQV